MPSPAQVTAVLAKYKLSALELEHSKTTGASHAGHQVCPPRICVFAAKHFCPLPPRGVLRQKCPGPIDSEQTVHVRCATRHPIRSKRGNRLDASGASIGCAIGGSKVRFSVSRITVDSELCSYWTSLVFCARPSPLILHVMYWPSRSVQFSGWAESWREG